MKLKTEGEKHIKERDVMMAFFSSTDEYSDGNLKIFVHRRKFCARCKIEDTGRQEKMKGTLLTQYALL